MSTILLNEFLTRFVTGFVAWLVILVMLSLLVKWRWRVLKDEVESGEKNQFHSKSGIDGASMNGKFFKVDLPVFIILNLVWYISATWIFMFSQETLFSSSTTIQSNLSASLNSLSFIFALSLLLNFATVSFFVIEFFLRSRQILEAPAEIRS